ncbi:MAG TPA: CsgG/HfaB family protein [Thermoanaerobaculia bacterium]|nr:CsgG/HfaB family protein [Thermoanaerobaculia bacterium]
MRLVKAASAALAALTLLALAACSSGSSAKYTHPNADLGAIKRVAVLPFENLTQERSASDKVQKVFLSELLATEAFDVVEPGLVVKALKAERIESIDAVGPAEAKRLGETLKAQGLFTGAVVDFAEGRSGNVAAPEVTIQLRLIEVQSGVTIWTASKTKSGASASARLFGVGGQTLTEAARELMRGQLKGLVK